MNIDSQKRLEESAEKYINDGYKGSDYAVYIRKDGQKDGYKKGFIDGYKEAIEQIKDYLEKKKKDIMNNPYTGHCLSDMNLLDEIINELFNEK